MEETLFSVVVTIYNKEEYLVRCITSIIEQTFDKIEVILIDDGSTDKSAFICDILEKKDNRIRVMHKKNEGLTSARKEGIQLSRGKYILFVDADDYLNSNTCEIYADYIKRYNPDILIDGLTKIFPTYSKKYRNAISNGFYINESLETNIISKMLFTGNFYEKGLESYICAKAIKRECLEAVSPFINPRISFAEGGVWLYSVMLKVKSALVVDDCSYNYVMNEGSMAISNVSEDDIFLVYQNLLLNIKNIREYNENLFSQVDYLIFFFLFWKNLKVFNYKEDEIYPYLELKKNSKIIIYGAWRFGRQLYQFLKEMNFTEIVLVVDVNAESYTCLDYPVYKPDKIREVNYDYIILGSEVYSVVCSMRETLKNYGINENILFITTDIIDVRRLPQKFLEYRDRIREE